jgi:hypothetical protein
MSLVKRSDVKNHLSPRFRTKIHLCESVSQPDATGFSSDEPDTTTPQPAEFADDFIGEHSSSGAAGAPSRQAPVAVRLQAPSTTKSARV